MSLTLTFSRPTILRSATISTKSPESDSSTSTPSIPTYLIDTTFKWKIIHQTTTIRRFDTGEVVASYTWFGEKKLWILGTEKRLKQVVRGKGGLLGLKRLWRWSDIEYDITRPSMKDWKWKARIYSPNSSSSRLVPSQSNTSNQSPTKPNTSSYIPLDGTGDTDIDGDDNDVEELEEGDSIPSDEIVATFQAAANIFGKWLTVLNIKSEDVIERGEEEVLFLLMGFIWLEEMRRGE